MLRDDGVGEGLEVPGLKEEGRVASSCNKISDLTSDSPSTLNIAVRDYTDITTSIRLNKEVLTLQSP